MNAKRILEVQKLVDKWNEQNAQYKYNELSSRFFANLAKRALLDEKDSSFINIMKGYLKSSKERQLRERKMKKMDIKVEVIDNKIIILQKCN